MKAEHLKATVLDLDQDPEALKKATQSLERGRPVGMPTETVYGLAARAFDPDSVLEVYKVKERPSFDPLIIHVDEEHCSIIRLQAAEIVSSSLQKPQSESAEKLIQMFWPGPLTLALPRSPKVLDLVTSGLETVAVRCPSHPVAQQLIRAAKSPLVAPSANRFGRISPTTAEAVIEELGDRIEYVLNGNDSEVGVESTVIRVESDGSVQVLRPGKISKSKIAEAIPYEVSTAGAEEGERSDSPGRLPSHYAPRAPLWRMGSKSLRRLSEVAPETLGRSIGASTQETALILFEENPSLQNSGLWREVACLSPTGELNKVAHTLFKTLRKLDGSGASAMVIEDRPFVDGIGLAIADRLMRASSGRRLEISDDLSISTTL